MLHDPSQLFALLWSGRTPAWPSQLLALIWIAWLISWAVASFWSGRTEKHVMIWASQAYRVPIIAGAILLTPWTAQVLAEKPLWHFGNGATYALVGLTLAGMSFTWWARIYLGRFWSSAITRKERRGRIRALPPPRSNARSVPTPPLIPYRRARHAMRRVENDQNGTDRPRGETGN